MKFIIHKISGYVTSVKQLSSHRSYKRLLAASFVSGIGDRVGYLAFLAAVSAQSQDVVAIGGITIAEMLPGIIALPVVQYVVDRFDKRRLLLVSDLFRVVVFIIAAVSDQVWLYFACGFLSAAFTQLFEPSRQALEPHYVPEGKLTQANGLRSSILSLVLIIGPSFGGFLVGVFGFRVAFIANAFSFLFSALMVFDLEAITEPERPTVRLWEEISGGFRAVRSSDILIYLFVLMSFFHFVIGIQFPLIFIYIKEVLHGGTTETGWLLSAIGIGGILGGLVLSSIPREKHPFDISTVRGRVNIAILAALDGVVVYAFTLMHSFFPVMILFSFFGVVGTGLTVAITTAITEQTAEEFRGRVFSLYQSLQGPLIVLSITIGIPLVREFGSVVVFQYSGSLEIVIGVMALLLAKKDTA